jgi:hypothetical protein
VGEAGVHRTFSPGGLWDPRGQWGPQRLGRELDVPFSFSRNVLMAGVGTGLFPTEVAGFGTDSGRVLLTPIVWEFQEQH